MLVFYLNYKQVLYFEKKINLPVSGTSQNYTHKIINSIFRKGGGITNVLKFLKGY